MDPSCGVPLLILAEDWSSKLFDTVKLNLFLSSTQPIEANSSFLPRTDQNHLSLLMLKILILTILGLVDLRVVSHIFWYLKHVGFVHGIVYCCLPLNIFHGLIKVNYCLSSVGDWSWAATQKDFGPKSYQKGWLDSLILFARGKFLVFSWIGQVKL